jgi:protein-arginine kinase activator protein McsA
MEGDTKKKKSSAEVTNEIGDKNNLKALSLEELDSLLSEVLEQEDYIRAITIRDEIKSRTKAK